jgi:hypothetical protein
LFGNLWEVELTYRYIFAFKFTGLSSLILFPLFALTLVANFPPVSLTPLANLPSVSTTLVKLVEKFAAGLREFSKTFKTVLMGYSGAGGKLIHKKPRSKKSRDTFL